MSIRASAVKSLRRDPTIAAFAGSLALGLLALEFYGRHFWFFGDEFAFLAVRRLGDAHGIRQVVDQLLTPHNEHLSIFPQLWYAAAIPTWGLRTYTPYITAVIVLHLCAAFCVWLLARRMGATRWTAWGVGTLFIFFGSGWENIFWGFQVGFIGSLVSGLVALLLVDHDGGRSRRDALATLLLLVSLGCSGVGVPMVVITFVSVLLRRNARSAVAIVAAPAVLFAIWRIKYPPIGYIPQAHSADAYRYAIAQLSASLESIMAVGGTGGVLLIVFTASLAVVWARGVPFARQYAAVGLVAGAVAFAVITGVGRASLGLEQASGSRYLYLQVAMLLPVIAMVLASVTSRFGRRQSVIFVLVALAIVSNIMVMRIGVRDRSGLVLALRDQLVAIAGDPMLLADAPQDAVVNPQYMPEVTVGAIRMLMRNGEFPSVESANPYLIRDLRKALLVRAFDPASTEARAVVPVLEEATGLKVAAGGDPNCLRVTTVRRAGRIDIRAPKDSAIVVATERGTQPGLSIRNTRGSIALGNADSAPTETTFSGTWRLSTTPGIVRICTFAANSDALRE